MQFRRETGGDARRSIDLTNLYQSVAFMPASAHVTQSCIDLCLRDFCVWTCQDRRGLALGGFEQLAITNQISHLEVRQASLARAEEFTRATKLQVELGDLESVVGADHSIEAALSVFRNLAAGHEHAIRLGCATADATAKLMKLGQPEAFRVFDNHHGRIRNLNDNLNHSRGHQNVQFALLEQAHDMLFQIGLHAAVQYANPQVGKDTLAQLLVHFHCRF